MTEKTKQSVGEIIRLDTDFVSAYARTIEALKAEGFGVLTEIDTRQVFKEKLGVEFPPYKILGACNPQLSHRALSADPAAGWLLPCNVTIRQAEDGRIEVGLVDAVARLSVFDDPEVKAVAEDAKARLARVKKSLEG